MLFLPSRASQKELAFLCQSLGTSLHSGIDLLRSLEMAARRSSGKMKVVLKDIEDEIQSGSDLTAAVEAHESFFPDLFADVVQIGEFTGALPESLKALARHYENNIRLKKDFISQITLPLVQLVVAVFVIAGMIFLLGIIGNATGTPVDVLGWGLMGTSGALTWLGFWAMGVASLFIFYKLISLSITSQRIFYRLLMSLPIVGRCLQDFAIARFSWAFHLTQNSGMPIDDCIDSSLRATSNGAFIAASDRMIRDINNGETLTDTFEMSGLFPMEFIQTVDVAETSGTVPEALHRLSPQFEENARRSLSAFAQAAGWVIWLGVAAFIIFIIFSIVFWYLGILNGELEMVNEI